MKEKTYHFIGIGGIGMGALATLLIEKGYKVSGSDLRKNQLTNHLTQLGANISIGHDPQNITGADFIVYSSAIKEDNPELKAAVRQEIPILQRAELLAELMNDYIGVTVAGAHGKTTTTSMISQLLTKGGLEPTTAVGGIIKGATSNARLGEGEYFVSEVDESDGSFLYFKPKYSIITNIDLEHIDYYHSWDNILQAYNDFIERTDPEGLVIAYGGDEKLLRILKQNKKPYKTFGFAAHNDVMAQNIRFDHFTTHFDCYVKNKKFGQIQLRIPGKHNVLNALAAITLSLTLSLDFKIIQDVLEEYQGVKRRFELKGEINDILVIDDYAHHPTEIKMTLETANAIKKNQLVAIFQPHRYSRLKVLLRDFAKNLSECDHLIVTDIYAASENPIEGLTAKNLIEEIKALSDKKVVYLEKEDIADYVASIVEEGDVVMTLGAGDITKVSDQIVHAIQSSQRGSAETIKENVS